MNHCRTAPGAHNVLLPKDECVHVVVLTAPLPCDDIITGMISSHQCQPTITRCLRQSSTLHHGTVMMPAPVGTHQWLADNNHSTVLQQALTKGMAAHCDTPTYSSFNNTGVQNDTCKGLGNVGKLNSNERAAHAADIPRHCAACWHHQHHHCSSSRSPTPSSSPSPITTSLSKL